MKFLLALVLSSVVMLNTYAQNSSVSSISPQETAYLKVYPNPCNGNFNIETTTNNPMGEVNMYILNILGQPVYHEKIAASKDGNIQKSVSVNTLPPGWYFIKIDDQFTKYEIIRLRID